MESKGNHHKVSHLNTGEWLIQNIYTTEDLRSKRDEVIIDQYFRAFHRNAIIIKRSKGIAEGDIVEFDFKASVGPYNLPVTNRLVFKVCGLDSFSFILELVSNTVEATK